MKRLISLLLAIFLLAFFAGCSLFETKASVRFQNGTSDIAVYYGIGLGDAKYVGYFAPGNITSYYETDPGSYSVQLRTAGGSWATDTAGSFTVEAKHKYSVSILGSLAGGYGYILSLDQ